MNKNLVLTPYEIHACGLVTCRPIPPNYGGWAYVLSQCDDEIYEEKGGELNTNPLRMQLAAVYHGICKSEEKVTFKRGIRFNIYTDCRALLDVCEYRIYAPWKRYGVGDRKEYKNNKFYWLNLIKYFEDYHYSFYDLSKVSNYATYKARALTLANGVATEKEKIYEQSRSIPND